MARPRQHYTIFPRKMSSGKTIYYYRFYISDTIRSSAKSTGQSSKILARKYCEDLFREGKFDYVNQITFKEYTFHFYEKGSTWYEYTSRRDDINPRTLRGKTQALRTYFLPYLGDKVLADITQTDIIGMQEMLLKKLNPNTVNVKCAHLSQIFKFAVIDGIIDRNPMAGLPELKVEKVLRDSFTLDEVRLAMSCATEQMREMILLCALTGMRKGEACAVRADTVHDTYIDVKDQRINEELEPVKQKTPRIVPICEEARRMIADTIGGEGYFYKNTDKSISCNMAWIVKKSGLKASGRKVSFHSLRHFFNTWMLAKRPDLELKIAYVMGHSMGRSAVRSAYTNFKPEDFTDIMELQRELFLELTK